MANPSAGPPPRLGDMKGFGKAKACIVIFQQGGPSHHDTFDMKPDAPVEIRGEFKAIETAVPGYRVCEHMPLTARQAHRFAVVRSVHHDDSQHNNAGYATLTGTKPALLPNTVEALATPRPDNHPYVYSMVFAGGGVRDGITYGASDSRGAYPERDPVTPQDIAATIYHCLGIDPETRNSDRQGRPVEVGSGGKPIRAIAS